jgi:hypothetical protein
LRPEPYAHLLLQLENNNGTKVTQSFSNKHVWPKMFYIALRLTASFLFFPRV